MSQSFDTSEKEALAVIATLILSCNTKLANSTPEQILKVIKAAADEKKYDSLFKIIKTLTRSLPLPANNKKLAEYTENIKTKDPYKCFLMLMREIAKDKNNEPAPKIGLSGMSFGDTDTPPPLCSTKIVPDQNVMQSSITTIRDKVLQAASGGLSKTAQRTSFQGSFPTSPLSPVSQNRSRLLWDFNMNDIATYQQTNASAIPIAEQEIVLLNELLYCLIGISGSYITPSTPIKQFDPISFTISNQIQKSLSDVAFQILPLASHYSQLQRLIKYGSDLNSGPVLQACAGALRSLMHDYYESTSLLEVELMKGNLTLQKLLYHIRPTISTMEILADTMAYIAQNDIKGGRVLTVLHDKIATLTGDAASQKMLMHLTQQAAAPYMEILQLWILKGVIVDPQLEFLIEDNERIEREDIPEQHYSADYWEKRYVINREKVPRFLEKLSDIILRTGKYLNVIRQCGKNVVPPLSNTTLSFSHTDQNYVTFINSAYCYASRMLLELLIKENDLMGHLQSVKRYFLLQQGDFIAQFMDTCEQELSKNVDDVLPMRLENLLELTLRLSSAKHDLYNDDLKTELLPYDLITQISKIIKNEDEYWITHDKIDLTGFECFSFTYDVKWPISLVLNHIAISKYQMLFRQLFYCKHVERQLNHVWISTNHAKKFSSETAELYRSAFTLRQRMMNAIQNLEYYMMIEVVEPNWHVFIENMNRVENVDDVLTVHQDFLDLCLRNCMVTDSSLLRSIVKLCTISLRFCDFIQKAQRHFVDAELTSMLCTSETSDQSDSEYEMSSQKQSESSLAPSETFSERVKRFDLEFTGVLLELLKRINDISSFNPSDKFINLVHRINFNSFYSDQLKALCANDSMRTQNF